MSPDSSKAKATSGNTDQGSRLFNRREFVIGLAATGVAATAKAGAQISTAGLRKVYIVPNMHPASCGWLDTFSAERNYCANNYLAHLDRVRDDPNYAFALSEVNNLVAIMNFKPDRIAELKSRIHEQRVELVNGYFLESTINLSGGEALVRLGVEGLRWYERTFGVKPRYSWNIDCCGTHEQMAQIAAGLGFEALVYTRGNQTGKTLFWTVSPDGTRILSLVPGHYAEATQIFSTKKPLGIDQMRTVEELFESKKAITPKGAPILILGGSGDYSLPPLVRSYPTEFLQQWRTVEPGRQVQFTTLSAYVDSILPGIRSGSISIPSFQGGTPYTFDAFWIENAEVKTLYRRSEHALQAAEALATIASLHGNFTYPVKALYDSWILMSLNMDRNTLWGSAAGVVFVSKSSWDAKDRFDWVQAAADRSSRSAGEAVIPGGSGVGFFNPLNWNRNDPITVKLPDGKSLDGVVCEALADGSTLCQLGMPSMSAGAWRLSSEPPRRPQTVSPADTIETSQYIARIDSGTGALASLKLKPDGRELLSGAANVVVAEWPTTKIRFGPGDFMPARPQRKRLGSSSDRPSTVRVTRGAVAITVEATGTFYGGGAIRRTIRFYHDHPRIDFETELNDVPNHTVVVAEFPLAEDVTEVRRGVPYGFSHAAWSRPDPSLHGWAKGIVPAVRWIDYALAGGGGLTMLDRGLTGREIDGRTPIIYLLNAVDKYHGYPNAWLSGKGSHKCCYSVLGHPMPWVEAHIPQLAWEYNVAPIMVNDRAAMNLRSFLHTSDNIIVEAMRREGDHIEIRFVECFGLDGVARIEPQFTHEAAFVTDLTGKKLSTLPASSSYELPVRPQQIITLHLAGFPMLREPDPVKDWDGFVPEEKRKVLDTYNPNLIGHPPFG